MKEGLTPYSRKAIARNGSKCLTELSIIYTTRVRAANLPPMCFHPDAMEPIMNERMV